MDDADDEQLNAADYYATLNVPRDASQEDVAKAYRKLAQVFHPDKHQDPQLKSGAQEAFGKLQEAYEVLSNVHKRQIYDIYGKQGLVAGFEVGERLHSVDELKKEWDEFKRKREQEQAESSTIIKGLYQCRIDATDIVHRGPSVRSIVVTNSVDMVVGGTDGVHVQGQAAVKNQAGTGNIIFGYTRPLSQQDTLDGQLVFGLRSLATLTASRQLGPFTTASASATWGPTEGLGFQLSSSRQLPGNCTGAWAWVLGPSGAAGMSLTISHRRDKLTLQGKLDLGAITALSARASVMLTNTITMRAIARLGQTGIDLEVGASKRFNPSTTGYLGTVVGLQGLIVKARVSRNNQTVEFPIIISTHYDDWRSLLIATVGPPLVYYMASRFVVRPLLAWRRRVAEQAALEEYAEELISGRRSADQERALLAPVARRKARAEAAKGGLVILEAVYGRIATYREQLTAGAQAAAAGTTGQGQTQQPDAGQVQAADHTSSSTGAGLSGHGAAEAGSGEAAGASGRGAKHAGPMPRGGSEGGPAGNVLLQGDGVPPPWLRVTEALQYLVVESRLELHPGVSKVGLMGFTDPAPKGQDKQLYVAYWQAGAVRECVVDDMAGLVLGGSDTRAATTGAREGTESAAAWQSAGSSGRLSRPGSGVGFGRAGLGASAPRAGAGSGRQDKEQSTHTLVEEPGRREWLLHQGMQCLGLSPEALALVRPQDER